MRRTKLIMALLVGAISPGLFAQNESGSWANSLRAEGEIDFNGKPIKYSFYSENLDTNEVLIDNKLAKKIRFISAEGFIADVAPMENFKVPCAENGVLAGRVAIRESGHELMIYEDVVCNDLIVISEGLEK